VPINSNIPLSYKSPNIDVAGVAKDVTAIRGAEANTELTKLKTAGARIDALGTAMANVKDPESYAYARDTLIKGGLITPDMAPEQYDPAFIESAGSSLKQQKAQLDMLMKQLQITNMQGQIQERSGVPIPVGGQMDPGMSAPSNMQMGLGQPAPMAAAPAGQTSDDLFGGAAQEGLAEAPIEQAPQTRQVFVKGKLYDQDLKTGQLSALPSAKEKISMKKSAAKESMLEEAKIDGANIIYDTAQDVLNDLEKTGQSSVGRFATSALPGSKARNIVNKLDTIKAKLGFEELAKMRAASPTGGALGQVAVRELDFLQAALANLDPYQETSQLKANLKKIQNSYSRWADAVKKSGGSKKADGGMSTPAPSGEAVSYEEYFK